MSGSEAQLVNVYDDEYVKIQEMGIRIQSMWRETARHINIENVKDTANKCNEFSKRVEGMFLEIGFVAAVDTTPIYADKPPTISLLERTKRTGDFDHERKMYEVKQSRARGGK
jgi:hypothetical protein